ncbi:MAG: 4'-phosphopantetheinyl transferase family protein [Chitinophagaceae bacterium]
MPLILERQIGTAKKIGVWQITEPIDFFLEQLVQADNPSISRKRLLEQVCSAHLLNTLLNQSVHNTLDKDANGKPFLREHPYSISFSHSKNMVACLIDTEGGPAGIDIEYLREGIKAIAPKFVSEKEGLLEKDYLHFHLVWGAKEVLYKIYSLKELDFLEHLSVDFQNDIIGTIRKNTYLASYKLQFEHLDNFILVWNV